MVIFINKYNYCMNYIIYKYIISYYLYVCTLVYLDYINIIYLNQSTMFTYKKKKNK